MIKRRLHRTESGILIPGNSINAGIRMEKETVIEAEACPEAQTAADPFLLIDNFQDSQSVSSDSTWTSPLTLSAANSLFKTRQLYMRNLTHFTIGSGLLDADTYDGASGSRIAMHYETDEPIDASAFKGFAAHLLYMLHYNHGGTNLFTDWTLWDNGSGLFSASFDVNDAGMYEETALSWHWAGSALDPSAITDLWIEIDGDGDLRWKSEGLWFTRDGWPNG